LDNVFIDRLWWTVKCEEVYPKVITDGHSLYRRLARYFEHYNSERKHSAMN
jgi:putative transposase